MAGSNWDAPSDITNILMIKGTDWTKEQREKLKLWFTQPQQRRRLLGWCVLKLGPTREQDAEDLLHDYLLSGWVELDGYDPSRGAFTFYLTTSLRNFISNWARSSHQRRGNELLEIEERSPAMSDPFLFRAIEDCKNGQMPREKVVLSLLEEGYDASEIAEKVGVNGGHARVIIYKARLKLRRCLAGKGVDVGKYKK